MLSRFLQPLKRFFRLVALFNVKLVGYSVIAVFSNIASTFVALIPKFAGILIVVRLWQFLNTLLKSLKCDVLKPAPNVTLVNDEQFSNKLVILVTFDTSRFEKSMLVNPEKSLNSESQLFIPRISSAYILMTLPVL